MSASNAPLETFLSIIDECRDIGALTDKGLAELRGAIHATLPHLPTIIALGTWSDWTSDETTVAVEAATKLFTDVPRDESHEYSDREMAELNGNYVAGLVIGLALAHALQGAGPAAEC